MPKNFRVALCSEEVILARSGRPTLAKNRTELSSSALTQTENNHHENVGDTNASNY